MIAAVCKHQSKIVHGIDYPHWVINQESVDIQWKMLPTSDTGDHHRALAGVTTPHHLPDKTTTGYHMTKTLCLSHMTTTVWNSWQMRNSICWEKTWRWGFRIKQQQTTKPCDEESDISCDRDSLQSVSYMRKATVAMTPQVWKAWWNSSSAGYFTAASMMIHQPVKHCKNKSHG